MHDHIRQWGEEHKIFLRLLDVLEQQIEDFGNADPIDYSLMFDMTYFTTRYPHQFHLPTEDAAMRIATSRETSLRPSMDELHRQNDVMRRHGEALYGALNAVVAGVMMPRSVFLQPARQYVESFRFHIKDEEQVTFPMVQELLGSSDWRSIEKQVGSASRRQYEHSLREPWCILQRQIASQVHCDCAIVP